LPEDDYTVTTALLVIDVQNDFCEGGVLAAQDTSTLLKPLNRTISRAMAVGVQPIFTRDWHPVDHSSFTTEGGPWPPHCVQGTPGALFASGLLVPKQAHIVSKGVLPDDNGYSMFVSTDLREWLNTRRISVLAACGIATEYCVLDSVKDALRCGFAVSVLRDLIRPIEAHPGDAARAIQELRAWGADMLDSHSWLCSLAQPHLSGRR